MHVGTLRKNLGTLSRLPLAAVLVLGAVACASTQSATTQVDDTAIKAAVKTKITADPETNPFEIKVDVNEGVVQLTGTVDEQIDRTTAARLARNTAGVVRVENEIEVGPKTAGEMLDDATITTRVKAKIVADPTLNPFNIQVTTEDAVVYLTGRVATVADKNRAHDVAHSVSGVEAVKNNLEVGIGG